MISNILLRSKTLILSTVLIVFFLYSCDDDKVDHSAYIPNDSFAVFSINTEQIFSDAFFDLIANSSLSDNIEEGPLTELMKDPANGGFERLDKYYLFATGSNVIEARLGAVIPLEDSEKLSTYIKTNFSVDIKEIDNYNYAQFKNDQVLVWNQQTAIYVEAPLGGDILKSAIGFFEQDQKKTLFQTEQTFGNAMSDQSHVVAWFKNDEFLKHIDDGVSTAFSFSFLETLKITEAELESGRSIYALNFTDGKLVVDSKIFKNNNELKVYKGFSKVNSISGLLSSSGAENPVSAIGVSLTQKGLLDLMKTANVDVAFEKALTSLNVPFKVKLDFLVRFFAGDLVLFVNDFEEITKNKMALKLNVEGEQEQVIEEVIEKTPQFTGAVSLQNEQQFNMFLKMGAGRLPVENGVYNFNNQLYFSVKNGMLLFTNTAKGVDVITDLNDTLSSTLKNQMSTNAITTHVDLHKTFDFAAEGIPVGNQAARILSEHLSSVDIIEQGLNEQDVLIGKATLNFSSDEHSLISMFKLINTLKSSFHTANLDLP